MKKSLLILLLVSALWSCTKDVDELSAGCKKGIWWLDIYEGNYSEAESTWKYIRTDTSLYLGMLCGDELKYYEAMSKKPFRVCWNETNLLRLEIK